MSQETPPTKPKTTKPVTVQSETTPDSGDFQRTGNLAGTVQRRFVQQERVLVPRRVISLVMLLLTIGGGVYLYVNALSPKQKLATASPATPTAPLTLTTAAPMTPTAGATATPTETPLPTRPPALTPTWTGGLSNGSCRAKIDGNGYIENGLYSAVGWSMSGDVLLSGLGWRDGADFNCNLRGISETVRLMPTWTATPLPIRPPDPTATPTPKPALVFWCEGYGHGGGHVVNQTAVPLGFRAGAYSETVNPGGSIWINPNGAMVWTVSSGMYATLTVDLTMCRGGAIATP